MGGSDGGRTVRDRMDRSICDLSDRDASVTQGSDLPNRTAEAVKQMWAGVRCDREVQPYLLDSGNYHCGTEAVGSEKKGCSRYTELVTVERFYSYKKDSV